MTWLLRDDHEVHLARFLHLEEHRDLLRIAGASLASAAHVDGNAGPPSFSDIHEHVSARTD